MLQREVRTTLRDIGIHESWSTGYRTAENDAFYRLAFDYVARVFGHPDDDPVLDAGCGSGTKTFQLVRRGYRVVGVDLSEKILEIAAKGIAAAGMQDSVTLRCEDLTSLTFEDGRFGKILCWGVLMHVPDVERAVAELVRVARPGAVIVVSEGNMWSAQAVAMRTAKLALGRKGIVLRTAAGLEAWDDTPAGKLVTRQARIAWLIRAFEECGARLVERRAGQFTELFTITPWRSARRLIHGFNSLWFRRLRLPGPAFANLLVFRKR
jgi:ubiquinone/menaquinone biosynthesis C-methylase UbiE